MNKETIISFDELKKRGLETKKQVREYYEGKDVRYSGKKKLFYIKDDQEVVT